MIGTISIECSAKNPNFPLHPLRAFQYSPSSIRITNVPKRIGKWCIENISLMVVYPDGSIKTAACVLTGGVWTGTVEGTSITGTSVNGYTIFASGTDENGNTVTGYILGKGDVVVLDANGTLTPDPARYYVRMLSAESENPYEGDLYPTASGYMIWQDGEAHPLGITFSDISAYVDTQISSKADLTTLNDYYTKNETSSSTEISNTLADKADLSALDTKRGILDFSVRGAPRLATNGNRLAINGQVCEEFPSVGCWTYTPDDNIVVEPRGDSYVIINITHGPEEEFTLSPSNNYQHVATLNGVEYDIIGYVDNIATENWVDTQVSSKADLSAIPTKTSELSNDSGYITSANIITKRDINDLNIYIDPMVEHTPMEVTVWHTSELSTLYTLNWVGSSWYYTDGTANIQIYFDDYSNTYRITGNIEDMGGTIRNINGSFDLTPPFWSMDFETPYFYKIEVASAKEHIVTKEYVDSSLSALEAQISSNAVNNAGGVAKIQSISQADYDAISSSVDLSTLYVIPEEV